jgi:hypothetical protein
MIPHHADLGVLAISPPARALLAFQIAAHWGNRATPRPCARAEVLAAVLAAAGAVEATEAPSVGAEQEAMWATAIAHAAAQSRYVAYLASHHISQHAALSPSAHRAFLQREEERRTRLRAELLRDPRYAPALAPKADLVNRSIVRLANALAALLARVISTATVLPDLPQRRGLVPLTVTPVTRDAYRLQPWPLAGHRLTVHAEGHLLRGDGAGTRPVPAAAVAEGPAVRVSWTLLPPAGA